MLLICGIVETSAISHNPLERIAYPINLGKDLELFLSPIKFVSKILSSYTIFTLLVAIAAPRLGNKIKGASRIKEDFISLRCLDDFRKIKLSESSFKSST